MQKRHPSCSNFRKEWLNSLSGFLDHFFTRFDNGGTGYLRSETLGANVTTYIYNGSLWLTGVNASGSLSTYTYRADGKRIAGIESGGTLSTTIWDGENYLGEY